jgi:hypothetical protein
VLLQVEVRVADLLFECFVHGRGIKSEIRNPKSETNSKSEIRRTETLSPAQVPF